MRKPSRREPSSPTSPESMGFDREEVIFKLEDKFNDAWGDLENYLYEDDTIYYCSSCGYRDIDINDEKERCNGPNHHTRHSRHVLVQYHKCFSRKVMDVLIILHFFEAAIEKLVKGEEVWHGLREEDTIFDDLELDFQELGIDDNDGEDENDEIYDYAFSSCLLRMLMIHYFKSLCKTYHYADLIQTLGSLFETALLIFVRN
ncbi:hypothetical protein BDF20DRAFT_913406 [Mycotypha africana]|uniref:uncharacterized protein n=1 Tax=Mycotypha africana TaxID=64632 RepID=UPI0023011FD3|nr:uncharacterized protein BDF20DRAFT_913406 [Mycotypha africana]KAI8977027.1 hypothetical protein BDF20DRAFT_913406 [Mycotypha africana]